MIRYRCAVLALAICAAGLSLAACTAGITSVTSSAAASRLTGSPTSSTASASIRPSSSPSTGRIVSVNGSIDTFPIPSGAKVDENLGDGKVIEIFFSSVTPSGVSRFYTLALPRAGYTITLNTLNQANTDAAAEITFTGHGYKGSIIALSELPASDIGIAGVSNKNFTTISLDPT
jgi:hypothetical protein